MFLGLHSVDLGIILRVGDVDVVRFATLGDAAVNATTATAATDEGRDVVHR